MHLEPDPIEQLYHPFASALEPVWDRVRTAAAVMASLRQEKMHLEERLAGLEQEMRRKNDMLAEQGAEVARLKNRVDSIESAGHGQAQSPDVLGSEERVQLQEKIKNALVKIDAYLSAS